MNSVQREKTEKYQNLTVNGALSDHLREGADEERLTADLFGNVSLNKIEVETLQSKSI